MAGAEEPADTREQETPPCPRCGAGETVGILYGYPTPETFEAVERGDIPAVVIGGCIVNESNPIWACPACRHKW